MRRMGRQEQQLDGCRFLECMYLLLAGFLLVQVSLGSIEL